MENVTVTRYKIAQRGLTFGKAFDLINDVAKNKLEHSRYLGTYGMRLPSWSPDVVIRVQYPDKNSKMTAPYLYVQSRYGMVPWKETNIELFSSDWVIVELLEDDDNNTKDVINNKKKQEKKDDNNSISVNFNGKFITFDEKELKELCKKATSLYENDLLSKILFGND